MKKITDPNLLSQLDISEQAPQTPQAPQEQPSPSSNMLGELLKRQMSKSMTNSLGDIGEMTSSQVVPGSFSKGYGQEVPKSIAHGVQNISQLFGENPFPSIEHKEPENTPEWIGQLMGKGVGYGSMAAPIMGASESVMPAVFPQLLKTLLSSGTAGAALSPQGDRTVGAMEYAAPVLGLKAIEPLAKMGYKGIKSGLTKVNPEKIYEGVIKKYDDASNKLSDIFNFVEKQAQERGVSKVGEIVPDAFKSAEDFMPRTRSNQQLLGKAQEGDYKSVRRLYSKLGDYGEKAAKANDWEKKDVFDDIRGMINEGLAAHFEKTGHKDLSQWLNAAKSGYKQLKNLYEPKADVTLRKLVGSNREIPDTLKPLMKNSKSRKAIVESHPEVKEALETLKTKEKLKNAATKAKGYGKAASAAYLGSKLTGHSKEN